MNTDAQVEKIARILDKWNPLGKSRSAIPDLDGYRTEAADIMSVIEFANSKNVAIVIRDVLNEAFDLDLSTVECKAAADEIRPILKLVR